MINNSDLVFLGVSLLIIGLSYYFMIFRKPSKGGNEMEEVLNERPDLSAENLLQQQEEMRPKTRAELAKEAKKREKKAQKEVR